MNKDTIVRIARESGLLGYDDEIDRFAQQLILHVEQETRSTENLKCKSAQKRLATLWGYERIRQRLSEIELAAIGRKHFGNPIPQDWYSAAHDLENAHGIV